MYIDHVSLSLGRSLVRHNRERVISLELSFLGCFLRPGFVLLSFATECERGTDNYPLILEGCDEREDALPPRHDIRIRQLGLRVTST